MWHGEWRELEVTGVTGIKLRGQEVVKEETGERAETDLCQEGVEVLSCRSYIYVKGFKKVTKIFTPGNTAGKGELRGTKLQAGMS